jgi:hypothetical protein
VFARGTPGADAAGQTAGRRLALEQNSPSSFNPVPVIRFVLASETRVRPEVLNPLGESVSVPKEGLLSAGLHTVRFDSSGLASSLYLCPLRAGNDSRAIRMLLIR